MTTKFTKAVLYTSIALAGLGMAGAASAYQFEGGVGYAQGELEGGDFDTLGAGGTYYFGDVATGSGPLAEAAFIGRASGISLGYSTSEDDEAGGDVELDSLGASARFVSMDSGWLASAGYLNQELSASDGEFAGELDIDRLSLGVGRYFGDNNTVTIEYTDIEVSVDGYSGSLDGDQISLNFRGVAVGMVTHVFDASVVSSEIEDYDETGFKAGWTVYPRSDIGVGVSYSKDALGTSVFETLGALAAFEIDSQIIGLHASWFVSDSLVLGLCYSDVELSDLADGDQIGLVAGLRF